MRERTLLPIDPCRGRRPSSRWPALLGALAVLTGAAVAPAAGQPGGGRRPLLAAGPGVEERAPDGGPAERVALGPALLTHLLAVPADETARVADWPIAPGLRADVMLTRRQVYAPEARIFKVEGDRRIELPRSDLAFFAGAAEADETTRVFVALDPKGRLLHGFAQGRDGLHDLRPIEGTTSQYLVAASDSFAAAEGIGTGDDAPAWTCGEESLASHLLAAPAPARSDSFGAKALASLHTAVVAVDTDNELLSLKFANNTASATNYIASLFAAVNVMYERDLKVRLLQGTTFLRVSTTPDPYTGGTGGADGAKLNQFSSFWSANHGGIPRALAMLLSGKQSSASSASGIAWLNALCSKTIGYSFNQVFKVNHLTGDTLIVGHEIGHNFGSPHSHCYSPPIDNCYNLEAGCFAGTRTCPTPSTFNGVTNVTGSLMSYCHLSGLSGCNSSLVFHPRTVQLFDSILPGKINVCVFPAAGSGPVVSTISPPSGPTAGGTAVTVTGSNFQAGASVSIGGVVATSVVVASPTRLTAVTGPHAMGAVSVAVTNPGGAAGSLGNAFFYAPPPGAGDFFTVLPCRAVDTRRANSSLGGPAFAPSTQRTFDLTGTCGIPNGAKAVSANVTVVAPPVTGFFSFYPGNAFPLGTSTVSFKAGVTRANNTLLKLATDGAGTVGVQNSSGGTVHLLIDVSGYFL